MTCRPTTEMSTLSLHDALPISQDGHAHHGGGGGVGGHGVRVADVLARMGPGTIAAALGLGPHQPVEGAFLGAQHPRRGDRKSTRLNSSHVKISYAVFCLKKKKI